MNEVRPLRSGRAARLLPRRALGVVAALVGSLVVVSPIGPVPAVLADDDGLAVTDEATFRVDPTTGAIHVEEILHLTNTKSNVRHGNMIEKPYFTGMAVPVVAANFGVSADQNGKPLRVEVDPSDGTAYTRAMVHLANNLFAKKSTTVTVRYDVIGALPRSEDPVRATPAFVFFPAFARGDANRATVRVVVPGDWTVDLDRLPAGMTHAEAFGNTILTAENIADPLHFTAYIIASKPEQFRVIDTTDREGNRYRLRSWPVDGEWMDFAKRQVDAVPEIATLIGQPWPVPGILTVDETVTQYFEGYSGVFRPETSSVDIGEDLDQTTMLHELTHAWFNDRWFADRWVNEGLAETYAGLMLTQLGGTPRQPEAVGTSDPGAFALNDWVPVFQGTDAQETFGYNASYLVMKSITDEVGPERMRAVFDAVAHGTPVYRWPRQGGNDSIDEVAVRSDWRRLLDLLETVGGSKQAATLFANRVVSAGERDLLQTRAKVRAGYDTLLGALTDWAPPRELRRAMEQWRWNDATQLLNDALATIALRDQLVARAAAAGSTVPSNLANQFEVAVHATFPALQQQIRDLLATVPSPRPSVPATTTTQPPTTTTRLPTTTTTPRPTTTTSNPLTVSG